jgi:hypothetical protein
VDSSKISENGRRIDLRMGINPGDVTVDGVFELSATSSGEYEPVTAWPKWRGRSHELGNQLAG